MATVDRFVATSHASYPFEHSRELAGLRHQIILPVEDHLPTTQKTRGGIRAVWVLVASYKRASICACAAVLDRHLTLSQCHSENLESDCVCDQ